MDEKILATQYLVHGKSGRYEVYPISDNLKEQAMELVRLTKIGFETLFGQDLVEVVETNSFVVVRLAKI